MPLLQCLCKAISTDPKEEFSQIIMQFSWKYWYNQGIWLDIVHWFLALSMPCRENTQKTSELRGKWLNHYDSTSGIHLAVLSARNGWRLKSLYHEFKVCVCETLFIILNFDTCILLLYASYCTCTWSFEHIVYLAKFKVRSGFALRIGIWYW